MSRNHLLIVLAVLVCVTAALQFIATYFYLYWIFWWFDIFMHLLGGTFAGLLILWLRFFSGYFDSRPPVSKASVFFFTISTVLVIGIGWEVFERLLGHTWSIEGYYLDTMLDVVFDFIGSIVAFRFFTNSYMIHGRSA